jgi:hypothetical protein
VSRPSGHSLRSYNGPWAAGLAEGNECRVEAGLLIEPGTDERLLWVECRSPNAVTGGSASGAFETLAPPRKNAC